MENLENFYSKIDNPKDRISDCFQDYANDFHALHIHFWGGIEQVRNVFAGGYRIKTVQEYLANKRSEVRTLPMVTEEDEKDPVFIEKAQKLNDLAERLNSLGANVTEEEFKTIFDQVKKIIY